MSKVNIKTERHYKEIGEFHEGFAIVAFENKDNKKILWGFINQNREEIISTIYECVWNFENSIAKVKTENGKWGYINKNGDAVIVPAGTYHNIINVSKGQLKLYTIYSPPNHPDGTVHKTKADAEKAEEHH